MTNLSEDRAFATNYFNFISNSVQSSSSNNSKEDQNEQFGKNEIPEPAEQRELLKSFDQLKGHAANVKALAEIKKTAFKTTIQSNLFPKMGAFNSNSSTSKAVILSKTDLICAQTFSRRNLLLLHQIDSPAFRSPVVFDCLLKLVDCGNFSIIASIDNPGIVNLFSKSRFEQFNWIWMDCTTMQPYTEELNRFALDACTNSAAKQTPRAAVIVLQSLTSNSRSIFKLLAAHQLSSPETQVANLIDSFEDEDDQQEVQNSSNNSSTLNGYIGMSYHGLFQKCQENFVVTAEANFRTQLTEFTDHDLFKSLEGRDGSVMFFIPFYHSELRQIIQDI